MTAQARLKKLLRAERKVFEALSALKGLEMGSIPRDLRDIAYSIDREAKMVQAEVDFPD